MLAAKLIRSVETRWEEIATETIRRIRSDEDVPNMHKLSEEELLNWAHSIVEALKSWEVGGEDESLAVKYNALGRLRFESSVPLYEVVRCLHILKLRVIGFIRDHAYAQNTLEIYALEEFEHRVGLFFDWLLYNVAVGYEEARRHTAPQTTRKHAGGRPRTEPPAPEARS
jgi:hypothetical protein